MVSTPISGNPAARPVATSEVQNLNDQISNLNLEIQRLIQQAMMVRDQIGGLRDAVKAERANRPQHPGADASDKAKATYRSAIEASDARIAGFEDQIVKLNDQIEKLFQDVGKAEQRIRSLESQKGSASARDAERMRQELNRAKEELSAAADPDEADSEASLAKAEQFKLELKKVDRMIAAEGPDFKVAVKAFALMLDRSMVDGTDGAGANKATGFGVMNAGRSLPLNEPK
ncbi:MAG: hypothetical protein CME55_08270 [Halieaceae bacterium]|nr:hypothetical protein [Halieaceae bacterium]